MGLYNKYVDIDAEEESARRQALIDEMWADDAENEGGEECSNSTE